MTLIVELSKTEEAKLSAAAKMYGIRPEEYTRQLIADLPATPSTLPAASSERERHRGLDELVAESEKHGMK